PLLSYDMRLIYILLLAATSTYALQLRAKRVVNGSPQPWVASAAVVSVESSFSGERPVTLCGGTIIAPRVILTAAHCVYHETFHEIARSVRIRVAFNRTSPRAGKSFLSNDILLHPQYIQERFPAAFDLALIILSPEDKLPLCEFMTSPQLARLPSPDLIISNLNKGDSCFIVGWGKMEDERYSGTPQHANIVNVSEMTAYQFRATIIEGKGEGAQRACFGDSGGPLICEIDHIPYLIGVNSEIYPDRSIDDAIPADSSKRCQYSSRLHAVDIRKQLRTINALVASRGLLHTMFESQNECF
ncbi:hypothetical protein PMAYCL1PPCAC_19252, partial [Pristionchus mayeri]